MSIFSFVIKGEPGGSLRDRGQHEETENEDDTEADAVQLHVQMSG